MTNSPLHFHISISARRVNSAGWGDLPYAEDLARALEAEGHRATLFFRGEQPPLTGTRDVILRIAGPYVEDPIEGLPNLLWIISPPNIAPLGLLRRFQYIFSASPPATTAYRRAGLPIETLHQSTDPQRFFPDVQDMDKPELGIVFVGAHAPRAPRGLVRSALDQGYDVHVWGPGWDGIVPQHLWHGTRINPEEVPALYARTRIILNSHMPSMAAHGMMSNRTFDALSAGAAVISDHVPEDIIGVLPGLSRANTPPDLKAQLDAALQAPTSDAVRAARHDAIAANFSFAARARRFIEVAETCLAQRHCAPPAAKARGGLPIPITLSDPCGSPPECPEDEAMLAAADEVLRLASVLLDPALPEIKHPAPPTAGGLIHPMSADLRKAQELLAAPASADRDSTAQHLARRARRAKEVLTADDLPFGLRGREAQRPFLATRAMRGAPYYLNRPEGHSRDALKSHVALWPRRATPEPNRPIGVFLHLYYAELAETFAPRLARIAAPYQLYVSTDTDDKIDLIRQHLPDAVIRKFANRGRDIYPKFYGFRDAYDAHDIVLHLHGKRSAHSGQLDDWLQHILDALLPAPSEINRILSFFQTLPMLGIVAPAYFKIILDAAHWGDNRSIAKEIARRLDPSPRLPANDALRFPAGSMFWARTKALRPLIDLDLCAGNFPMERGQIDGTLAHAIERMIGVAAATHGYQMISVAPERSHHLRGHRLSFKSNKDLRAYLETDTVHDG